MYSIQAENRELPPSTVLSPTDSPAIQRRMFATTNTHTYTPTYVLRSGLSGHAKHPVAPIVHVKWELEVCGRKN